MGHFGDGSRWGVSLRYSVEEQLLGSAGGVKRLQAFFVQDALIDIGLPEQYKQANLIASGSVGSVRAHKPVGVKGGMSRLTN